MFVSLGYTHTTVIYRNYGSVISRYFVLNETLSIEIPVTVKSRNYDRSAVNPS